MAFLGRLEERSATGFIEDVCFEVFITVVCRKKSKRMSL